MCFCGDFMTFRSREHPDQIAISGIMATDFAERIGNLCLLSDSDRSTRK